MNSIKVAVGDISASLEDYLQIIYNISQNSDTVYVSEIAKKKSVKMPSVNKAIKKLCEAGFVKHSQYDAVTLTSAGKFLAKKVFERHSIIKRFFVEILGLDEKISEVDACKIEHYLHPKTLSRLISYPKEIGEHKNG